MKLELNFFTDSDGNHKVAIASPSAAIETIHEIDCETFFDAIHVLSNPNATGEELKEIISNVAAEISGENSDENINIYVHRNKCEDGSNFCTLNAMTPDGIGGWHTFSFTSISNKTYKKFCKGSTMQKLDIAYHAFEDEIKSGIFNH